MGKNNNSDDYQTIKNKEYAEYRKRLTKIAKDIEDKPINFQLKTETTLREFHQTKESIKEFLSKGGNIKYFECIPYNPLNTLEDLVCE